MNDSELMEKLIRVRTNKPKQLRQCGTGALLSEQQYCYDRGYRDGVAALRRSQREYLEAALKATEAEHDG